MSQEAPDFADGNKAFAKALNKVVEYCRRHGVNPAGRVGWSESIDGWVPPYTGDSASARAGQWRIRSSVTDGSATAEIRAGTLTGLGLSDYAWNDDADWEEGEWVSITHGEQVWLILRVSVTGAPLTYYSSPDNAETIYLPSAVSSADAELYIGDSPPGVVAPTVNFSTGHSETEGVYRFLIGSTGEGVGSVNYYSGPLGIGWCAPDTAHLVALTE